MEKHDFRILLVDDEADVREFLGYNLSREGYAVRKAKDGEKAIQRAKEFLPHLIILDVMMPGMDGMEVCHILRSIPELNNPLIVFLTARGEEYSQLAGFEAGADDYLTKPIKPRLFLARIQAFFRRYVERQRAGHPGQDILETTHLVIDRSKFIILKDGFEVALPKKEFELLYFLASSPGMVLTREEILAHVWGGEVVVGDRTIDVHVRRIRERLGIDLIRTVKGVGYKFEDK